VNTARHIQTLPPYQPIEPFEVLSARLGRSPGEIIKLDANENPYGPSPAARRALAELEYPHIYPDPESRLLRAALSRFTGLPAASLMAGAGSDELLDLLLRVCLEPGDAVLSCPPTFGMYAFDTHLHAGRLIEIPRLADFSLDLPAARRAIETERPKILFLASPNNPDGSLIPADTLNALLDLPVLVVLDEAYIEFSGQGRLGAGGTRLGEVPHRENLVVLRTFSKWAGLAGLRVGYGAFPEGLLPLLWKAKQPYNVNVAASRAAIASLGDLEYLEAQVAALVAERERMSLELSRLAGIRPYPSRANFLLCRIARGWEDGSASGRGSASGQALKSRLIQRGILIRYFDKPGLQDCIRISAGKPEQTDILLEALHEFL
jgi:histidinol-phosphate aminotransferase